VVRIDARLVARLHREARADRWEVAPDRFGRALEASAAKAFSGRDPSIRELERYLSSLRLDELALACACAEGHSAAWEYFVVEYRPILYRAADAIDRSGGARELADALYADLFGVPDAGKERRSLFTYFHGRSSLATWLRAVLAQRCVDRARAAARTEPLADQEPPARALREPDPDRPRLLALVLSAFRQALSRVDARDRLRLRYYYSQDLTLAETGRLLGEHEASVSRHLAAARKAIRRDVENQLLEARLAPDEISRCFECIAEDAGPLDLEALLGSDARNFELGVQRDDPSVSGASAVLVEKRVGKMK
jgi:RNA polymerase sigma-70 factor, ECF subfamily